MKDSKVLLGGRIKELRKIRGFSQEQLSEMVGVDSKHLSRIEVGSSSPPLDTLEKIANALKIELKDFFEFSPATSNPKELRNLINGLLKEANAEKLRLVVKVLKAVLQ